MPLTNNQPEPPIEYLRFSAHEIIYSSVFNPIDGRKNWQDMLSAFCLTCSKWPEATLMLKLVHVYSSDALNEVRAMLARFPMFLCRVVVICDFLDTMTYQCLISASKFAVNTSLAEGQCLPLMEAMSWGKPILAPRHTSISEYLDETVGFPIETNLEPCSWPHDPRGAIRAYRHRINWESAAKAFGASFKMARTDLQTYAQMSAAAIEMQRHFCSEELAFTKLDAFVRTALADCKLKRQ